MPGTAPFEQQIEEYIAGERDSIYCVQQEPYWPSITADEFDLLIDTITEHPHLHRLQINNTCFTTERMQRLTAALEHQPELTYLAFPFNKFSPETVNELVKFVGESGKICNLDLRGTQDDGKSLQILEDALIGKANQRNLHKLNPRSGALSTMIRENGARIGEYQSRIRNGELDTTGPELIWEIEQLRYSVIEGDVKTDIHTAFMDSLPTISEGETPTLDNLLKPDAKGWTPLDNPKTWRNHPDLLQELAKKGELNGETLNQRTPKGPTLAEYAFGFGDTDAVLQILSQQNIGVSQLAGTDAFEVIGKKGELGQLFTEAHWQDASRQELASTLARLSDSAKEQIPNRHQLLAGRQNPQQQAYGRE